MTDKPKRKPREKPFEACIHDPLTGRTLVLSEHTTSRAALNQLAFRAAFGDPSLVCVIRDKRTGKWVTTLTSK